MSQMGSIRSILHGRKRGWSSTYASFVVLPSAESEGRACGSFRQRTSIISAAFPLIGHFLYGRFWNLDRFQALCLSKASTPEAPGSLEQNLRNQQVLPG